MNIESRKKDNFQFNVDVITEEGLNFDLAFQGSTLSFEEESLGIIREISVSGTLERVAEENIFLKGLIIINAFFNCARCIKPFERTMELKIKIFFKKEASSSDDDDDDDDDEDNHENEDYTEAYPYHGKVINILQPIRDSIALSMPMRSLCSEKCKGLCQVCGIDLNKEKCDCETKTIDPRFEALKKISQGAT